MCRGWQAALDGTVTALCVGPKAREAPPHHWNRQQLMMQRLPALFPCLRSLDFNQARRSTPSACPLHASALIDMHSFMALKCFMKPVGVALYQSTYVVMSIVQAANVAVLAAGHNI